MAIFGRKKDEPAAAEPARDQGLTMPNPRPGMMPGAATSQPSLNKDTAMSQTLKPGAPPAPNSLAQRPGAGAPGGVGMPARPQQSMAQMGTSDRRTLTVGKGISVQGTVADCERLVVEGTVESQMLQAAELSIGATGVFRGEVQVEDAEVAGLFDGTITARGNLIIRATGKVNGVARCKRLSVEDGGQLTGRMEMLTEGSAPPPGPMPGPMSGPMSGMPAGTPATAPAAPIAPARPATVG